MLANPLSICYNTAMNIPQDAAMLYSFVNMKLRDAYSSLSDLCDDMEWNEEELLQTLAAHGYEYAEGENKLIVK